MWMEILLILSNKKKDCQTDYRDKCWCASRKCLQTVLNASSDFCSRWMSAGGPEVRGRTAASMQECSGFKCVTFQCGNFSVWNLCPLHLWGGKKLIPDTKLPADVKMSVNCCLSVYLVALWWIRDLSREYPASPPMLAGNKWTDGYAYLETTYCSNHSHLFSLNTKAICVQLLSNKS